MKKSILFSVLVVGATLLQAQSITVHQTCGQNGKVVKAIPPEAAQAVDLGLSVKWANMNVGATNPEGYGDYFAWGETATKDSYAWYTYFDTNDGGKTFTKYYNNGGKTVLDPEDDAARVNWGGSWRMPTKAEWQELLSNCTWTSTKQNGINGYKVTSKKAGYTDKFIFLPETFNPSYIAFLGIGFCGFYWSSSLYEGSSDDAWFLDFDSGSRYLDYCNFSSPLDFYFYRCNGQSVWPVLQASSISSSSSDNDTIRIYSNGCDDYQTFIGSHNSQLTMTANSDQWSHFVRWNDGNTDNPRTITTNGNADYTAYFETYRYSVQVQSSDAARGSAYISKVVKEGTIEYNESVGTFDAGSEVYLASQANYGYHFAQWSDGNTSPQRSFILSKDTTFTAEFAKNTYSINKSAEHGSISGNSTAEYLDYVTLTVTPDYGYHFTQWSDGLKDNPRTIVVTQDTTMEAIFDYLLTGSCGQNNALTWTLDTTSLSLNISGSGALSKNYTYGTFIKSLTIEDEITQIGENAFANFINLKKVTFGTGVKVLEQKAFYNCSAIDTIFCYSQRPPTVNTNALYGLSYNTVVYVPAAYLNNYLMHDSWGLYDVRPLGLALQLSVNIPESGEVFGAGSYEKGATTTISATPNYGYHFVQWNDGNTDNPRMIIITQDTAFVANFAPNQYSISVNCDKAYGRIEGKTGKFDYKTQHTYTVIPNYGYHFAKWSDGNTANPRTLTLTQDTILTASFAKNSYTITLQSANPEQGAVAGSGTFEYLEQKQISAIPNYGYHLDKWSDGNTDNPRTITLTQDTILTAYFAVDKSGTCGKDNILQWSFSEDRKLTISGKGELTANYTFGVEAPTQMKTLIIGNEVTAIGERAFYGKSTINHLVLGAQLSTIGDYAFAECKNFDDITCYAQGVPAINATTFANVGNKQYIYLYVPEDRERAYKRDTYWGEFDVQVKGASETTTDQNVTVTPNENSAIVTWPTDKNAATYTLQITKDGVVFCTLIFNGAGQLIGISFAPSRDGSSHAPAATVSVAGMSFTVTGLSSASKYAYNLSVADDNNQELVYYQGEFATTGYEGEVVPGGEPVIPGGGTTAIDNVNSANQPVGTTKFFRNGQLFIQRGNELFNAQGARVK